MVASLAAGLATACTSVNKPMSAGSAGPACADVDFPIYFAKGSDALSDPAHQAIVAGAAEVRACKVAEVDVFGLADMDGPANNNLALSRRRASVVAQALIGAGLPAPLFDVQGLGESGARTARGRPALLQRKTDVVIHVTPNRP